MKPFDPKELRNAFGSYMTGVTVVTSKHAKGENVGFTANSFSSVSLDPPLLLVCPGKFLSSYEAFENCTHFAVNVLAEGQEEVASTFAGFKGDRFSQVNWHPDKMGIPLITGALAQFSCKTHQVISAGDHSILIGEVIEFSHGKGRGLGYAGGQFFSLGLERAALETNGKASICGAIISNDDCVMLEETKKGLRPLSIESPVRGRLRQTLSQSLAERDLNVSLGPAYSVFDEGNTQNSFFLATLQSGFTNNPSWYAIADIPMLKFASQPISDMMNRFFVEAKSRSFGLYLGDAESGDVHHLTGGN